MCNLISFIKDEYQFIISLSAQVFIGYHIFFLSKRLNNSERLNKRDEIKVLLGEHISKVNNENLNCEVYLINTPRFFKDYPSNEDKLFCSYTHLKAEVKNTSFEGIELFNSTPIYIYRGIDNKLHFNEPEKFVEKVKVFPVGVVPYENIDYFDPIGDESSYKPSIFCKFYKRGKFNTKAFLKKYPYKELRYYQENDNYSEGDPYVYKWNLIREKIHK